MSKNIFIAGKDYPASMSFVQTFLSSEYKVVTHGMSSESIPNLDLESFHPSSFISAKSFLIAGENHLQTLDNIVLYFDGDYFSSLYDKMNITNAAKITDQAILGFQYLTLEAINRINTEKSRIIFILKECQDKENTVLIKSAEEAFKAFVENLIKYNTHKNIQFLLFNISLKDKEMRDNTKLSQWLCNYISCLDKKNKNKTSRSWKTAGKAPIF